MSFSSEVKKELTNYFGKGRHCDIAELAAMVNTCGTVAINETTGRLNIKIQTENPVVAKKYFTLLKKTFNISSEISIRNNKKFKKIRVYFIYVNEPQPVERILNATGVLDNERGNLQKRIDPLVVKVDCCKRAYIRGAFISGGSLSDPEKGYHLEFVNSEEGVSRNLLEIISSMGLNAKMIKRKTHYVVYLKEGENIVDLLNMMGAHKSLMDLENLRIIKDMRNSVNRIVNCETANLNKVVTAAVSQIEDILYIEETQGLEYLSEQLEEVARVRLQNPEASLKEIGAMLTLQLGKSGVNHRLRKISEIAENLRGGLL